MGPEPEKMECPEWNPPETRIKVGTASGVRYNTIPYRCPICFGLGTLKRPAYTTNATLTATCHACGGSGVLWG